MLNSKHHCITQYINLQSLYTQGKYNGTIFEVKLQINIYLSNNNISTVFC